MSEQLLMNAESAFEYTGLTASSPKQDLYEFFICVNNDWKEKHISEENFERKRNAYLSLCFHAGYLPLSSSLDGVSDDIVTLFDKMHKEPPEDSCSDTRVKIKQDVSSSSLKINPAVAEGKLELEFEADPVSLILALVDGGVSSERLAADIHIFDHETEYVDNVTGYFRSLVKELERMKGEEQ
ncbi:hypothetical protein [Psychromonas aquimarina]|uniref:hypothetical protein n=1 Tax=Psychromonas aquimarina TaxID=444919 RepID=UPI0003FC405C|nr:hypothetical protein [Psychromonas aquimarina]